jgi:hypothetical protein
MIDISTEAVVTLTEATRHLPRRRKGKPCAVSTVYRWAQRGCRGVRLETIQVGGTKCTSMEALQRFCERLSRADSPEPPRTPARRRRAAEAAARELEREGV